MTECFKVGLAQINNSFSGAHYLPYAAGLLQAYAQEHLSSPQRFIFLPPLYKRLPVEEAAMKFAEADIVGFSLYVWNQKLSLAIARRLKEMNPKVLVVFGGPQVPDNAEAFCRENPFIDVVINGEGETAFARLLESFPDRNWADVPSISFVNASGDFIVHEKSDRIRDLDSIPSPYLNGIFDELMKDDSADEWLALWETNRGCPFQCTFCDWGSATQTKIFQFSMDRLEREMRWFSDRK
ncbi:MAG: cobalamin-dependent protein, partial [Rhodospirillales bacterium]|nr:cobalamin-dependent protein [Rhodospirillales bacterium]